MNCLVATKYNEEGHFCHADEGELVRFILAPDVKVNYMIGVISCKGVSAVKVKEIDSKEEDFTTQYISLVCTGSKYSKDQARKDALALLDTARIYQPGDILAYKQGSFQKL